MSENPGTTATTTPADPAAPATSTIVPRPAPRIRTMVLGLILLVIAGYVLLAQLTDIEVDPGVAALGVMLFAGVLLIAGARRSS